MKQILLMRHAKSSWSDPTLADHDRPLNKRGNRTAKSMGEFLLEKCCVPEAIVSSTACRAADTAKILVEHCEFHGELSFDQRLYHASPRDFGYVVSEVPDSVERVMLVSHNPGIEEYLYTMTGQYESMPTATIAAIDLEISSWLERIAQSAGTLSALWRPKEI